ncbi:hypothetical protein ACO02O_01670 [Dirofilaria immitis]
MRKFSADKSFAIPKCSARLMKQAIYARICMDCSNSYQTKCALLAKLMKTNIFVQYFMLITFIESEPYDAICLHQRDNSK